MAEGAAQPHAELEPRQKAAVDRGARLAAALLGAGVGALGGPVGVVGGAVAGWAAGEALPGMFLEVLERVGNRGGTRAAAALVVMEVDAVEREAAGETVRDDGFFDPQGDERQSSADELLEAVLRQAAEAVEEEKLPFLSRIYTAVERDAGVSPAEAQYLVGLAGRLTFRQLVALSVFSHHDDHEEALMMATVDQTEGSIEPDPGLRVELVDLINQQLVGAGDEYQVAAIGDPLVGLVPRGDLGFGQLRLLPVGQALVRLMGLDRIDESRRLDWLRQLGVAV
jgi:hypothetical protein